MSNEDREMLELAAKAADMEIFRWEESKPRTAVVKGKRFVSSDEFFYWAPLDDDGDAFRLAVKLKIHCYQYSFPGQMRNGYWAMNGYVQATRKDIDERAAIENDDRYAATRLAIVLVAAEIGRGGKEADHA